MINIYTLARSELERFLIEQGSDRELKEKNNGFTVNNYRVIQTGDNLFQITKVENA